MDVSFKLLSLLLSLSILVNAYIIKRIIGTWLFPACIFSLFWFAYSFFPLIILFEVPVNPMAMLYITTALILFSWSSVFFNWKKAFELNRKKPKSKDIFNTQFLKRVLNFSIILSILFTIKQVTNQGITLSEIIAHPLIVSEKYSVLRYTDQLNNSKYYILSLLFSYISVLVGGLLFGSKESRKDKIKILICFLPSLFVMFTQGAKGLFFLSVFLFLGSLLVTNFHDGKLNFMTYKNNIKVLKITVVVAVLLFFSFLSRGLYNIKDMDFIFYKIKFYFTSYTITHMYAFSDWFTAYIGGKASLAYDTSNNYFGYYTFTSLAKLYGPEKEAIAGVYGEYFMYENLIKSNIFTAFRGFIMDFTLIGSLIFIFLNGFLIHLFFYIFLKASKPVFTAAILVFVIGYFYITYIISLLTWNITVLAFVSFIFILVLNKYKFVIKNNKTI